MFKTNQLTVFFVHCEALVAACEANKQLTVSLRSQIQT